MRVVSCWRVRENSIDDGKDYIAAMALNNLADLKREERQYARAEAARQQQRLAEAAQTTTVNALEKGRPSGRGRLTAVSNSSNRIRSENTGGVFGAPAPSLPKPRGGGHASAVSVASEEVGQSTQQEPSKEASGSADKKIKTAEPGEQPAVKTKKKTTTRARAAAARSDDPIDVSSEDDVDEDARRDIEQIWISSDEEALPSRTKGKQKESRSARHGTGLRPLRALRDSRVEGEPLSARNRVLLTITKAETGAGGEGVIRGPAKDDSVIDASDKTLSLPTVDIDKKSSKRKSTRVKDAITGTETAEEHAERLRYNQEVRKLLGELYQQQSPEKAGTVQAHAADSQKGGLYLFQFPPMTPALVDPAEEVEVKREPGIETTSASEKTNGVVVKKEEGTEEKTKKKADVLTADNMRLPSGLAGTLRVHKSGKVTLDWGGTDMEVRYGTEVDFLQDVVMTNETEQTAWALGQVEKKMVCIPNWQKLYE